MKSVLRHEVHIRNVLIRSWVFYEHPNFFGRQYELEKGGVPMLLWGALKIHYGMSIGQSIAMFVCAKFLKFAKSG